MRMESYARLAPQGTPVDDDGDKTPLVERACRCRGFVICGTCLAWDQLIRRVEHRHNLLTGGAR